jgi:hypothetical protein
MFMRRIAELGPDIREATAENAAETIRVFGSVARGDDTPASDIDFLVTLRPGATMFDLARLELRLEAIMGRRVGVVTEAALRGPVRREALRDAIDI